MDSAPESELIGHTIERVINLFSQLNFEVDDDHVKEMLDSQ